MGVHIHSWPVSITIAVPDQLSSMQTGVVFSLSGFKNPLRANLRGKATDMGAKFQPDWTDSCTHLV